MTVISAKLKAECAYFHFIFSSEVSQIGAKSFRSHCFNIGNTGNGMPFCFLKIHDFLKTRVIEENSNNICQRSKLLAACPRNPDLLDGTQSPGQAATNAYLKVG